MLLRRCRAFRAERVTVRPDNEALFNVKLKTSRSSVKHYFLCGARTSLPGRLTAITRQPLYPYRVARRNCDF